MRHLTILAAATLLISGCASIVSGSHDDILVKSEPEGADCTVYRGADVLGQRLIPLSQGDLNMVSCQG